MTTRGRTRLFFCGDVMTGRGVDQILSHPSQPRIYEPGLDSATAYVALAEAVNGPIPRRTPASYIWGDALAVLADFRPNLRVINLETAVTRCDDPWPGKGINYRMNPDNVDCLTAAGIDVAVLANNHVLDWGHVGLQDTLDTLGAAGVSVVGAGTRSDEAIAPLTLRATPQSRLKIFAFAAGSSGVPPEWDARADQPGVARLSEVSARSARDVAMRIRDHTAVDDVIVVSIHWGGNWGYAVPADHQAFAKTLIDEANVSIVHGHSSHHPLGIGVHSGRLILYGCGDLLNDYEGISGYECYRPDLTLLYLVTIDGEGGLVDLELVPMRVCRFRLQAASREETQWLREMLERECAKHGARVVPTKSGHLKLLW